MTVVQKQTTGRFQHDALLYSGDTEFVTRVGSFIRESVESLEPILVVVPAYKIDLLRQELGHAAREVTFADMAEVGANPARIIPAWREFVDHQSSRSVGRFRGVGEPISAHRSDDQLIECQRHEALLNVAFAGAPAWWLVCPYDTASLRPDVIEEAYRTHPQVANGAACEPGSFRDDDAVCFGPPLPEPDGIESEFTVDLDRLDATRTRVALAATDFGVDPVRVRDLMLAVSEVATNTVRYGGGSGIARMWTSGDTIFFEIRDKGCLDAALVGRVRPAPGQMRGYGLWLANQVCDLVQIRTNESGTIVRLHMSRAV